MKLKKCDRCGKIMAEHAGFGLHMCGDTSFVYRDRFGACKSVRESYERDLCVDCARVVAEMIENGKDEEEGQECTRG